MTTTHTDTLRDILLKFRGVGTVDLAAVVGADGLQIESVGRPAAGLDIDSICAVASTGLALGHALGTELTYGDARQTMIEFDGGAILIDPISADAFILVVTSDPSAIGRLRFVVRRHRDELVGLVGAL